MHWRKKWQPTPVFSPGESQGWGRTESDMTEVTWQQWQQYSKAETVYCSGIEHQRVWLWFHLGLEKIYP